MKLNVLHWHITDVPSIPFDFEKFPQLRQRAAFSPAAVYTADDARALVTYAQQRGVRIVPEIDMPGHGGWYRAMPELGVAGCPDVLDPTENRTYEFLTDILSEIVGAFSDELLFLGGDEVNEDFTVGYHCFDRNPKIARWLATHKMTSRQLLDYFWRRVTQQVLPALPQRADGRDRQVGVWFCDKENLDGNGLYPPPPLGTPDLPPNTLANVHPIPPTFMIVQPSDQETCEQVYENVSTALIALSKGAPTVLSLADNGWYVSSESEPMGADWVRAWSLEPCDVLDCADPRTQELLRGGEADVWGIGINRDNWHAAAWHGTMAVAERLWSAPLPALDSTASLQHLCTCPDACVGSNTTAARTELLGNATRRLVTAACHMRLRGVPVAPVRPSPHSGPGWNSPLDGAAKLCGDGPQRKGEENVCRCPSDWL